MQVIANIFEEFTKIERYKYELLVGTKMLKLDFHQDEPKSRTENGQCILKS